MHRSLSPENIRVDAEEAPRPLVPEQRLLLAVLRRAVWDYVLYRESVDTAKHQLSVEAQEWLFSDVDEWMSFMFICKSLDINPSRIRRYADIITRKEIENVGRRIDVD